MTLAERYRNRLLAKLPEGAVFRRDFESSTFKLLAALAKELGVIDARVEELLADSAPWESVELLPAWEHALGLPSTGTLEERQAAVAAKLADQGGCSIPYFVALGSALGYDIWITEYSVWRCGVSSCIDPITSTAWANTWTVHYLEGANDALLEQTMIRARPSHTYVHFTKHYFLTMDGEQLTIDGEPLFV